MTITEAELLEHCLEAARSDLAHCEKAASLTPFRAGDSVKHALSGETWILACDQRGNDVLPAGWPETLAKATHCRLVKAATDAERIDMLRRVAGARPSHEDTGCRVNLARRQLEAEPKPEMRLGAES